MILSHKHRFIFIKTSKTAGTSIELALSRVCGPDDIITPVMPADEQLRRELGGRPPQNHRRQPFGRKSPRDWLARLGKDRRKPVFYNHMPASEIRALIPRGTWNDYYKICFERNPWDRVISLYYWKNQAEPRPSIPEFVRSDVLMNLKRRGIDLYTIEGRVVVDRVARFENLTEEIEVFRQRVGIEEALDLPRAKSGIREEGTDCASLLGEAERRRIAELFRDEIELMGYEFRSDPA